LRHDLHVLHKPDPESYLGAVERGLFDDRDSAGACLRTGTEEGGEVERVAEEEAHEYRYIALQGLRGEMVERSEDVPDLPGGGEVGVGMDHDVRLGRGIPFGNKDFGLDIGFHV
jgi:hypothetical protein